MSELAERASEASRAELAIKTRFGKSPAQYITQLQPTFALAVGNRFFSLKQILFELVSENVLMNLT